jgi:MFS family permease
MHTLPYWRLSGYYFFYFAFIGAFSPYFGLYLQSLSFSAWDIGLLMSQMQLMRLCAPYLWGALADHLAQRMAVVRLAALAEPDRVPQPSFAVRRALSPCCSPWHCWPFSGVPPCRWSKR